MTMPYFKKHVFFCLNQRNNGEASCSQHNAEAAFMHAKQTIQNKNLSGDLSDVGPVRINRSGCLGRCDEGPVCVVYPEGRWYQYVDTQDIDEIIEEDVVHNRPVQRLLLD